MRETVSRTVVELRLSTGHVKGRVELRQRAAPILPFLGWHDHRRWATAWRCSRQAMATAARRGQFPRQHRPKPTTCSATDAGLRHGKSRSSRAIWSRFRAAGRWKPAETSLLRRRMRWRASMPSPDGGADRTTPPDPGGGCRSVVSGGDPNRIDTVKDAYIGGSIGVCTETRMGFAVDGMKIMARHDFASKAIDGFGHFRNAGVPVP